MARLGSSAPIGVVPMVRPYAEAQRRVDGVHSVTDPWPGMTDAEYERLTQREGQTWAQEDERQLRLKVARVRSRTRRSSSVGDATS